MGIKRKKYANKMIALALLFVLLCAACGKAPEGLVVRDDKGNERVLVTDEAGQPVTDEAGNQLVVGTGRDGVPLTDGSGNTITKYIAPPEHYTYGDVIEASHFRYTVPKGWTLTDSARMVLERRNPDASLQLQILSNRDFEAFLEETRSGLALMAQETGTGSFVESDVKILGQEAKKLDIVIIQDVTPTAFETFVFPYGGDVIAIYFYYPPDRSDAVDMDLLINQMQLKPLQ